MIFSGRRFSYPVTQNMLKQDGHTAILFLLIDGGFIGRVIVMII